MKRITKFSVVILTCLLTMLILSGYAYSQTTSIKYVKDITKTIFQNSKYTLPKTVSGVSTNNKSIVISVKWNVSHVNTNQIGSYIYYGSVKGYNKKVILRLNIQPFIKDIPVINVTIIQHEDYELPTTITTVMSDGTSKDAPVTWENTTINVDKPGEFIYKGKTDNYNKDVILKLTIQEKELKIDDYTPKSDQKDAKGSDKIQITFSDDVVPDTNFGKISLTRNGNKTTISPKIEDNILTIETEKGLEYSSTYNVIIPAAAIKSVYGSSLKTDLSFQFKTIDSLYEVLKKAMIEENENLDISAYPESDSTDKVFDLIEKVDRENPAILYYEKCRYRTDGKLELMYKLDKKTAEEHLDAINKKIDEIIKEVIKPTMSEYDKELAIHDYIIRHSKYDEGDLEKLPPEDFSAYGVLVLGKGVCESYSEAMKMIMDKLGIECLIVFGDVKEGPHEWNIIKIGGSYYQLDVTWDTPSSDGEQTLVYDYFNVTDDFMKIEHKWNISGLPVCNSTNYNYFYYNKLAANTPQEFRNLIKEAMFNKTPKVTFFVPNYNKMDYNVRSCISSICSDDADVFYGEYSYYVDEVTRKVTIEFKLR